MAYEFRLPDLGEGVTEGEITAWLVQAGQAVAEDDPMLEVETDKATVEIPCPVDGTVGAIHVAAGTRTAVGTLLVTIDDGEGDAPVASAAAAPASAAVAAAPVAPAAPAAALQVKATPGARRLAQQLGLGLAGIAGSGPRGAVTETDVRTAAASAAAGGAGAAAAADVPGERRERLAGTRRRIAERLTRSHQEVPKVTVVEECDFTDLAAARNGMSYVPYVLKAVASGIAAFEEFNATIDGEDVVFRERSDIGVAAQGPRGLVVPVIRDVAGRDLAGLNDDVTRLAEAVRDGSIAPEDLRGSTFTVTLAGKLGGYFATPLVNLGEAAILGVHRIAARPVVLDDAIVVRQIGLVSCSFDHRITDGTRATQFLLHVIDRLQRVADA